MFGDNGYETSTGWNYKLIGRYVLPWEFGVSGSWNVQSGGQWGRVTSVNFPGDGAQNIRMEPVDIEPCAERQHHGLPLRQVVHASASSARLTGQIDVFNMMNSGTVTVFRTTTGATVQGSDSASSTRASSASACGSTSKGPSGRAAARRPRSAREAASAGGATSRSRMGNQTNRPGVADAPAYLFLRCDCRRERSERLSRERERAAP